MNEDGRGIPIANSGAPIKSEAGDTIGVAFVSRDQTEERKAQQAVQDTGEFVDKKFWVGI